MMVTATKGNSRCDVGDVPGSWPQIFDGKGHVAGSLTYEDIFGPVLDASLGFDNPKESHHVIDIDLSANLSLAHYLVTNKWPIIHYIPWVSGKVDHIEKGIWNLAEGDCAVVGSR